MAKLWHFDRNLFIGSVQSVVTFSCDEPINKVHHMEKLVLNFDCAHNFDLTSVPCSRTTFYFTSALKAVVVILHLLLLSFLSTSI